MTAEIHTQTRKADRVDILSVPGTQSEQALDLLAKRSGYRRSDCAHRLRPAHGRQDAHKSALPLARRPDGRSCGANSPAPARRPRNPLCAKRSPGWLER
jgi:hypothetical protein